MCDVRHTHICSLLIGATKHTYQEQCNCPFAIELFNGHKFDIREKVTLLCEALWRRIYCFRLPFIKHLTKHFLYFFHIWKLYKLVFHLFKDRIYKYRIIFYYRVIEIWTKMKLNYITLYHISRLRPLEARHWVFLFWPKMICRFWYIFQMGAREIGRLLPELTNEPRTSCDWLRI